MNSVCRICEISFTVPFTIKEGDDCNCVCGAIYIARRVECFIDGCNCAGHIMLLGNWEKTFQRTRPAKADVINEFNKIWADNERKYALGRYRSAYDDEFKSSFYEDSQDFEY